MTWRNKELAELAAAERRSVSPQQRDRERIREALRLRLDASPLTVVEVPLLADPRATAVGSGLNWAKVLRTAASVTAVALGVTLALRKSPIASVSEPAPTAVPSELSAPLTDERSLVGKAESPAVTAEAAGVAPDAELPTVRSRSNARTSDTLAQEIALIAQAEKDFHAGNLHAALTGVDEYRQRFPRGVLTRERRRLRIQILCRLGLVRAAESEQGHSTAAAQSRVPVCSTGTTSGLL